MPKSRTKSGASKNVAAAASNAPRPLLDCLQAQIQSSNGQNDENDSDVDRAKISTSGWQCDIDDWSDKKSSNNDGDIYPQTLRSVQRKNEQSKNKYFSFTTQPTNIDQSILNTNDIDISKLSLIIMNLINGQQDQSAYVDFLSILEHFSVHTLRDDHLEESVYHLIQAGVSYIRSNEERFDPLKLEECYQRRHALKTNSVH